MTGLRARRFGAARQLRSLRVGLAVALVTMLSSARVLACPMCFGAEESKLIDGTRIGVLVLLAVTLAVQGGFVAFFLYLRRRGKRNAEVELDSEWSQLQGASRTS